MESDLTVIYREELKNAKANQKFIAIKGELIFANETTLHTFLKETAEVFLINININNSVISSEVENVVDWGHQNTKQQHKCAKHMSQLCIPPQ